ncbi:B12-binding domain-containing radical SAM protein [bacterium]|nr:B12-binding domain-containing radical SAM protein [bacterium]
MNPKSRVFCVVPPTGRFIREDRCQTPIDKLRTVALRPPIDLLYAAGSFEAAGCEVRLKDYPGEEHGWDEFEADLRAFKPHAVLLSITTPSLEKDLEAASAAKRIDPSILTMAKGAHFNTLDVRALEEHPDLDVVLRGEYENTCRELGEGRPLAEVAGITWRPEPRRIARNDDRPFEMDLDSIPFPARHLAKNELYRRPDTGELQTTLVTNRGCPFHCIYCLANQVSGTKNRYRSVGNVMAEIRQCVERHGIRSFLFRSDLFTQNKKWVIELCQAIMKSGMKIEWACNSRVDTMNPEVLGWMKKAGCWIVALGVESGDQGTLDRIEKQTTVEMAFNAVRMLREAGLKSSVYLLMGLPWDTEELIDKQVAFGRALKPDFLEFFYTYPFPGTKLYDLCVAEGLLKAGEIPRDAYAEPAMPGMYLTLDELKRLRNRAVRRFYLRPGQIIRTLRAARNPRELLNYMKAGFGQLRALMKN